MWGGGYNPLIPVDDADYARALVRLFRVDVLRAVDKDPAVEAFIKSVAHLPDPFFYDELFLSGPGNRKSAQIVDIFHPIRRLYDEHFKVVSTPPEDVLVHEWDNDDPLGDVLLQTFGALPDVATTGTDYLGIIKQDLQAQTVALKAEAPLPEPRPHTWTVSSFCRSYMKTHYSVQNHWDHDGFYVGSANDFDDLVTFWNLRATDIHLLFVDPAHSARFDARRAKWLEVLRSRPKGRFESDDQVAIWSLEGKPQPDTSVYGKRLTVCTVRPGTWNGLNVKAPYMYFSEGSSLAAIDDSSIPPLVSFQLPPKPFADDRDLFTQHLVASVDPGMELFDNERATLRIPWIPALNEYYGRECAFDWDKARAEPDGLGIIEDAASSHMSLKALDVAQLMQRVFAVAGIVAEPSKPGLVASRLIQQMGGIDSCRPFRIAGVRALIENYGPARPFTRSAAIQTIRAKDPKTGAIGFSLYEDLYIEPRPHNTPLTPHAVFAYLLQRSVFRAGLRFSCPSCRLEFWTSLDDVGTEVACEYCGHRFNVTPYLRDRDWAFRRSGLFGGENKQEGAIPVVLTLQQLHANFRFPRNLLYTTAMALRSKSGSIKACETDFVALLQRPRNGAIEIVIGECKTRMPITNEDVTNLLSVAKALEAHRFNVFVIFSKLSTFDENELKQIARLNERYVRRAILLTARELEPYRLLYERTAKEFKGIKESAVTLEEMVHVTSQVFYGEG